jgi:hypothetical protein
MCFRRNLPYFEETFVRLNCLDKKYNNIRIWKYTEIKHKKLIFLLFESLYLFNVTFNPSTAQVHLSADTQTKSSGGECVMCST